MTFLSDPAGAVAVGVADLADVVDVSRCGSGHVGWDDRTLPGDGHRTWIPSQQDVDRQYVSYVGCAPMQMSGLVPVAGCSGSLSACSPDLSCPAADYVTCWEKLEAMSDDSYDSEDIYYSSGEVGGQPECFDYDDPRDYEEWCAWNDVDVRCFS